MATLRVVVCWVLLNVAVSSAAEQWYEAYDMAMNDIKTKNWLSAEIRLKAALKQQPEQGKKIRAYGARFIRYFPEYYLGVVYVNTARYQEALEQFLRVENKGLITDSDQEYAELSRLSQLSMQKLNRAAPGSTEKPVDTKKAETATDFDHLKNAIDANDLSTAEKLLAQIEDLDPKNPEITRYRQAISERKEKENQENFLNLMDQAEQELLKKNYTKAETLLTQATQSPAAKQEMITSLQNRIDLAATVQDFRIAVKNNNQNHAENLAKKIEKLDPQNLEVIEFRKSKQPQETKSENPDRTSILLAQAKQQMKMKNYDAAGQLAQQIADLDPKNPQLAHVNNVIQKGLAIQAFYAGRYQEARKLLQQLAENNSDRPYVLFYLGCTNAAIAYLKLNGRNEQLQEAKQQFHQARQLNPSAHYDTKFISPRIIELYNNSH